MKPFREAAMSCSHQYSYAADQSINELVCWKTERKRQLRHEWLLPIVLLSACLIAGCRQETSAQKMADARKLVKTGEKEKARQIAAKISPDDDHWAESQFMLGMMEWQSESFEKACEYFDQIPLNGNSQSLQAAELMSDYYLKNCRLSKAVEKLEYTFRENAGSADQRATLTTLLVLGGRRSRADYHLMELLKSGQIELKELVLLTQPDRRPPELDVFLRCMNKSTDDALTNYAAGSLELVAQDESAAVARLRKVVEATPKFAEAQALLGETLFNLDLKQFEEWLTALPDSVSTAPSVWFVRGLHARSTGQNKSAVRCFWETVRKEPLHRRAIYQLGQSLGEFDRAAAEEFSRRFELLAEAELLVERVLIDGGKKTKDFLRLIEILMECGRHWEAHGWISRVADENAMQQLPSEVTVKLSSIRGSTVPRFTEQADLTKKFDLSHFPLPEQPKESIRQTDSIAPDAIRFADESREAGLEFSYHQSPDSKSDGVRIFESTGGGIGILDFDGDCHSDILLTQGEPWPIGMDHPADSMEFHDSLFRKVGSRFIDVSTVSGVAPEGGYGQGCSVGDINNDGFSDLYIANVGTNRLLISNGDGTFSDQTTSSGISGQLWTTSCCILDLNSDGNPDLYDVNYLAGDAVYKVECSENECSVRNFPGEEDQVQLSNGDGTFRIIPDATPKENSKGLGIVAMFSRPDAAPTLFIANDQVPNYLLTPVSDGRYTDEAGLRGVAVNCDGRPTACMGIAASDINGDRLLDLFVTNFESEANCLYLQDEQGFFFDSIRGTGLMAAGVPYVGWGTQFLDAENDQILDLVVTNGHVADFGKPGKQYQMPLQFFRGQGQAMFQEAAPTNQDTVFGKSILGRSLAVVDWNQDGRQDFVVSALESPAILATNRSESNGHFLRIKLHARSTARDAIGSAVVVNSGQNALWQQLNAGDGYQASNERVLHLGLGEKSHVDSVTVQWPSGKTEVLSLPNGIDQCYVIVEDLGVYACDEVRSLK